MGTVPMTCPVCNADAQHAWLGKLGTVDWYRCRACGILFVPPQEEEEDDG